MENTENKIEPLPWEIKKGGKIVNAENTYVALAAAPYNLYIVHAVNSHTTLTAQVKEQRELIGELKAALKNRIQAISGEYQLSKNELEKKELETEINLLTDLLLRADKLK